MTPLHFGIACMLALASSFSSCATTPDADLPDDPQVIEGALTGPQINTLIVGNTGFGEEEQFNWRTHYASDGTMTGRIWGDAGQETDNGTWEITAEAHLCRQWQIKWGDLKRACFEVYKDGEAIKLINMDGNADSYEMMMASGNRVDN
jgi:hypothetical protein